MFLVLAVGSLGHLGLAQEPKGEAGKPTESSREALFQKFRDQMNGVKMIGQFTILGKENGSPAKEKYTIQKVEKLPDGDKWLIHARIKYGQNDLALPLPLDVKWAGGTAVITLDEMTIPGLGTFSSRVVIDDGKYAGTWRHDKVSGHLFGTIEKLSNDEQGKTKTGTPKS